MIGTSAFSCRAESVMKMFSASESTQAITARARSMPACTQHLVVGGAALDEAHADVARLLGVLGPRVDHDVALAGRAQVAGDLAADAAEAADDHVVGQGVDGSLLAALVEEGAQVPGDEELDHRHQGVEQRTDAEHDQDDPGDLAGDASRAGCARPRSRSCRATRGSRPTTFDVLEDRVGDRAEGEQQRRARADQRARRNGAARRERTRRASSRARIGGASVVVGLAGEDLVRAVELLEQHDARELVRQRHRAERERVRRRRRAPGRTGRRRRSTGRSPLIRRSSRKRLKPTLSYVVAADVEQRR